jgi:hypothetical protein
MHLYDLEFKKIFKKIILIFINLFCIKCNLFKVNRQVKTHGEKLTKMEPHIKLIPIIIRQIFYIKNHTCI